MEIEEEIALAKRVEVSMDVNHWKKKFLYPYANIAPIPDSMLLDDKSIAPTSSP